MKVIFTRKKNSKLVLNDILGKGEKPSYNLGCLVLFTSLFVGCFQGVIKKQLIPSNILSYLSAAAFALMALSCLMNIVNQSKKESENKICETNRGAKALEAFALTALAGFIICSVLKPSILSNVNYTNLLKFLLIVPTLIVTLDTIRDAAEAGKNNNTARVFANGLITIAFISTLVLSFVNRFAKSAELNQTLVALSAVAFGLLALSYTIKLFEDLFSSWK